MAGVGICLTGSPDHRRRHRPGDARGLAAQDAAGAADLSGATLCVCPRNRGDAQCCVSPRLCRLDAAPLAPPPPARFFWPCVRTARRSPASGAIDACPGPARAPAPKPARDIVCQLAGPSGWRRFVDGPRQDCRARCDRAIRRYSRRLAERQPDARPFHAGLICARSRRRPNRRTPSPKVPRRLSEPRALARS